MTEPSVPKFLREAFEEGGEAGALDAADANRLLERSLQVLSPEAGAHLERAGLERLMQRTSELPEKYAPFFDQLIDLFDVDEATLRRDLERARDPRSWKPSGLPGVRLIGMTAGPRVQDAETALVRFAAGVRFPRHRHRGSEVTLILEGGYTDEMGKAFHPGDLDPRDTGGEHSFRTFPGAPCIAASANRGFDFFAWPLRLLQKLAGRG